MLFFCKKCQLKNIFNPGKKKQNFFETKEKKKQNYLTLKKESLKTCFYFSNAKI